MDGPDNWRWIWLIASALFVVGEIFMPGTFFLLSFGVGAGAASLAAFLGGALAVQWLVFVVVSALAVAVLYPIGRRLDAKHRNQAVGATRFAGREATVLAEIPAGHGETGLVRFDREEWRAETVDATALPVGAVVEVLRVEGTRLIVSSSPRSSTVMPEVPQEGHQSSEVRRPGAPDTN